MDLDDDPVRPLYQKKSKDTHFAAAHQTQAISKLVGKALAALAVDHTSTSTADVATGGTASSSQPGSAEPRYHEGLTVIVCGSWNALSQASGPDLRSRQLCLDEVRCTRPAWAPSSESSLMTQAN